MGIPKIILLAINILGGAAVIGSYVLGFVTHPGSGNALRGGISVSLRSVYGLSMILSALGYFAFDVSLNFF